MWCTYKIIFASLAISCLFFQNVQSQSSEPLSLSPSELQVLLNFLYAPNDELFALQRAALRQQLKNLLEQQEQQQLLQQQAEERGDADDEYYFPDTDKRSITSLARGNGALMRNGNLNVAALVNRVANSHSAMIDEMKRSLASLAKTGQLPSKEPDAEDGQLDTDSWQDRDNKRSLGSLARSGNLLQSGGKRSLASLRKNDMMPYALKRSLAALARERMLPSGKRNIGSMARDYALPNQKTRVEEKRNLGALKNSPVHGRREKRQVPADDLDIPEEPIYETLPQDFENVEGSGLLYPAEKRFLGSLARTGGFRSRGFLSLNPSVAKRHLSSLMRWQSRPLASEMDGGFYEPPQKKHIGALARSGWLSSFRPVRSGGHFSRSERRSQINVENEHFSYIYGFLLSCHILQRPQELNLCLFSHTTPNRTALSPHRHQTDFAYPSPPFVGGARPSTTVVGQPRAFNSIGESRLDLQPFSGAGLHATPTRYFNSFLSLARPQHLQQPPLNIRPEKEEEDQEEIGDDVDRMPFGWDAIGNEGDERNDIDHEESNDVDFFFGG